MEETGSSTPMTPLTKCLYPERKTVLYPKESYNTVMTLIDGPGSFSMASPEMGSSVPKTSSFREMPPLWSFATAVQADRDPRNESIFAN